VFALNSKAFTVNSRSKNPYLIVGCHRNDGVINESKILFDRAGIYGYLVVGGEAKVPV
jgi:hypothetical protein